VVKKEKPKKKPPVEKPPVPDEKATSEEKPAQKETAEKPKEPRPKKQVPNEAEGNLDTGGSAQAVSAGGRPGAEVDYASMLAVWLEKHKKYPRRAQNRRQEGIVELRFTIDREGRVLKSSIVGPSKHKMLNEAALKMLEKAQPLPPIPADITQDQFELTVPVTFFIKKR
jgi:protein TonB